MEGYGGSGGSGPGFPTRQSSRAFPDPAYASTNGMLSRPAGNVPALSREDSMQNMSNGGSRTQQASHEVFMVREAARAGSTDRSPFATTGNRFAAQEESSTAPISHSNRSSEREKEKGNIASPKMLKVAVVGDSTSGKTAICNAFTSEGYNFSRNYHMTTGVSIYAKSIKLPSNKSVAPPVDDSLSLEPRINLVLVDSAGKPIYRELLPQYVRKPYGKWDRLDGLALVIDLTSSTALETASDWLNLSKGCMFSSSTSGGGNSGDSHSRHFPPNDGSGDRSSWKGEQGQSFLGVLIGTKNDLKDQRGISPKAAQDFASRHGLQYFECSAKENSGIEEPFFFLAHQWATTVLGGGPVEKENLEGYSGGSSSMLGGGRISTGRNNESSTNATSVSNSSRKSAFQSRQNSSEAF